MFRRRWSGNLHIGGKWPTVDVDVIESELWAEQGSVADPEATSTEPAGSKEDPAAESSRVESLHARWQPLWAQANKKYIQETWALINVGSWRSQTNYLFS